ncbi:MAG: hypothetical protein L3J66_13800 [Bacteroidales bacterium]|nr:hypothetical protein [Bacteroidales bacterium]
MKQKDFKSRPSTTVFTAITALLLFLIAPNLHGQVAINNDGSAANSSAMLDVKSTSKGLLLPRLTTTQQKNINNPAAGLLIFNTDSSDFYGYNGTNWISIWTPSTDTIGGWTCGDTLYDSRDGKKYATVQIGTQCWMSENLNIGIMIWDDVDSWDNDTIEKYCYDNLTANCDTSGGLYQWDEVMGYTTTDSVQGICPAGWHIPSDSAWKTMEVFLGMSTAQANATLWRGTTEGDELKNTSGWNAGGNGSNTSGFSALPGGHRYTDGPFYDLGTDGYFWTSTGTGTYKGKFRSLRNTRNKVYRHTNYNSGYGFSLRCMKN